ncbi:MAG TPA: SAM-dependent methyltransferase, partial [Acidimicrobiia bacterium]
FFRAHLDVESVGVVPVPADCTDHFGGSYWRRPEAYLDAGLVQGMSSFAQLDEATFARGAQRLQADLDSGRWDERLGHLRALDEIDLGYRIVSGRAPGPK